jgi:hypothetical protein
MKIVATIKQWSPLNKLLMCTVASYMLFVCSMFTANIMIAGVVVLMVSILFVMCVITCMIVIVKPKWMCVCVACLKKELIHVQLITYDGGVIDSLAPISCMFKKTQCSPHWLSQVGSCELLPNGVIDKYSESSYLLFWLPVKDTLRAQILLSNDLPDFEDILQIDSQYIRMKILMNAHDRLTMETTP